ncbi:putative N-acetyltransferase subunit ARD1 [Leptomonas pyrrhocoris]|uniref:Putative N-acetyltransferase subunit ARD1 n=1 Tax=Leptomonas pyrrhocoris TaxID=157538 RepID=A0A0M9FUU6_LEPPY|nr:putative N-acetyltransferase subunit ARD1 [Leptomonas pyrrhocoris]XP_015654984.1 putative N-acetyltransferase subunit ARD1 [Leptomonas pyrrhocoris]KPA76544.1 putative N-acetyltransferase subunit ARD1 [Leptomonas pyrrhocoris]KPA76545.1 putative N-acetyltransferase subunit ARD1 [Leptomonas pyrrhocoris]|eukprot:XP_015654983.1 putative N-acetyltransferase subunit ARD1 [Leptomonas pyrrhocoris]
MQLRRATMEDMYEMQHNNLRCLPENYNLRYYYYHLLSWPQLLYVQQDYNRNTVGYVLGKMDDEEEKDKKHGHITSLAVLRSHRKLGIASRVMRATMKEMDTEYNAHYCSLHVRKTNDAALHLYQDTLGFRCAGVEEKYYVDEEDAYHMKKFFHQPNPGMYVDDVKRLIHKTIPGEANVNAGGAADAGASSSSGNVRGGEKGNTKKTGGGAASGDASAKEREAAMAALLEMDEGGASRGGKGKGGGNSGAGNKNKAASGGKKNGGGGGKSK